MSKTHTLKIVLLDRNDIDNPAYEGDETDRRLKLEAIFKHEGFYVSGIKTMTDDEQNNEEYYNNDDSWLYMLHVSQQTDMEKFFNGSSFHDLHGLKTNAALCLYSAEEEDKWADALNACSNGNHILRKKQYRTAILTNNKEELIKKLAITKMKNYWETTSDPSPGEALNILLESTPEQSATRITEQINRRLFECYNNTAEPEEAINKLKEAIAKIQKQEDDEFKKDINIISSSEKSKLETILREAQDDKKIKIPALSKKINGWLIDNFSRP